MRRGNGSVLYSGVFGNGPCGMAQSTYLGRNTHWKWIVSPILYVALEPFTMNTGNIFPSKRVSPLFFFPVDLFGLFVFFVPASFPTTPTLERKKNWWQLAALQIWGRLVRILLAPFSSLCLSRLGQH